MRSRVTGGRTFTEQARRAQIIACAMEVISEIGYGQATIRKIADRVGVAMSVVLYHFANKDELVRAILIEAILAVVGVVAPAMDVEGTSRGKLHAYVRANVEFLSSHAVQYQAILDIGMNYRSPSGERIDQLDLDPDLLAQFAKLQLEPVLQAGQDSGEFRALDTKNVAVALTGALNGAVLEAARNPDFDVLAYGEVLVSLFDSATAAA